MSDRPEPFDREDEPPELTPKLAAALRALHPGPPPVPRSVDDAILSAARTHLRDHCALRVPVAAPSAAPTSAAPRRMILFPGLLPKLAVAAALVFGLGVTFLFRPRLVDSISIAREDIDRNGRVDMLDAFALARRLQSGAPPTEADRIDINGDGIVDQRDVDAIAAQAVKLTKG